MFLSRVYYPNVSGSIADFAVPFPYLAEDHVVVTTRAPGSETLVVTTLGIDFQFTSTSLIHFLPGRFPASGSEVAIKRVTDASALVQQVGGSVVLAEGLNAANVQLLYLAQEAADDAAEFTTALTRIVRANIDQPLNPLPDDRAGYYLAFDGSGQPIKASGTGNDAALRADLAANGSPLIKHMGRTLEQKLFLDLLSVVDEGAVGTGSGDQRAAIQAAITAKGVFGGEVRIPTGDFRVGASGGACLKIAQPVSLQGEGGVYSAINPEVAGATDDIILIQPNPGYVAENLRLAGFAIHKATDGTRGGRHGILLDTQVAGALLPRLVLERLKIGQGLGWAIIHVNNVVNNSTGGLFGAQFRNLALQGGIRFSGSGDSNTVSDTSISDRAGSGASTIGLDVSLVAGSSVFIAEKVNITTAKGAIRHRAGSRSVYKHFNIENFAAGALANNAGAVAYISGEDRTIVGGALEHGLISAFGASDATHLIKIDNTRGYEVSNVTLLSDPPTRVALEIGSTARETRLRNFQMQDAGGDGVFDLLAPGSGGIVDNGFGTMGLPKAPANDAHGGTALVNSWVDYSATQAGPGWVRDWDGWVRMWGQVKNGSAATIFTLPDGHRPAQDVVFHSRVLEGAVYSDQTITVFATGVVQVTGTDNDRVDLSRVQFPTIRDGNAVTPE